MKRLILITFVVTLIVIYSQCNQRVLSNDWVLKVKDGVYPAKIPSTVIDDLILNNVLPKDFYYRDNFLKAYQYEVQDAVYTLNFSAEQAQISAKYKQLIFEGLDTHCEVFLNNKSILQSRNMFRRYELNVQLQKSNNLTIKFYSPANNDLDEQKLFESKYGFKLPQNYSFTRKAAYHYGWDWGPRIVSMGIWKQVYLNSYNDTKFQDLSLKQISQITINTTQILSQINIDIQKLNPNDTYTIEIDVILQKNKSSMIRKQYPINSKQSFTQKIQWNITQKVQQYIWWVWELGEQPSFNLTAKITNHQTKNIVQKFVENIGLRTIKLNQNQSQGGKQFTINLNGYDIYSRGGNYIPPQMSLSQTNSQTYKNVVKLAKQQNFNMIRVWGGGHFQKDDFYKQCDQNGILIWHDLMYACALYPYSDTIAIDLQQQMRDNLLRLRHHPSIALWNGNNQIWIGWQQWGWKNNKTQVQKQQVQDMYKGIFQISLPKIIKQITPQIPYWQTSPSVSSNSLDSIKSGDIHFWRVWGGGTPIQQYNKFIGRFNSQYGMQSMPDISTIQHFTAPEDRKLGSYVLNLHQRHPRGDIYLPLYVKNNTHDSKNLTRFSYFSQIMQSYALQLATTSLRGSKPFNMGSLYWQLNDVWPVSSWASVDYNLNRKASHYKLKQIYQPLIVACYDPQPADLGDYIIYANNDYNKKFSCHFQIKWMLFNGTIINTTYVQKTIQPFQRVQITRMLSTQQQIKNLKDVSNMSFIKTDMTCLQKQSRSYNFFFNKMKNRTIINPQLKFEYNKTNNSVKITVKNIATYVWVYSLVGDKHYSFKNIQDNYFTLLPGQTRIVSLGTHEPISQSGVSVTSYQIQALGQIQQEKLAQQKEIFHKAKLNHLKNHISQQ